ncbi:class I SAM-dependent DNA methyltransferase [Ottowia pentelensis]|uniref:class I SAM-dependent DNA methyltransferase n=1 Tax=Ottowia pentelensis TaxID=511108 RepID=UPI00363580B1
MSAADFIAKWGPGGSAAQLNEEQGAQSHFLDLCELLGVPKPGSAGLTDEYVFERRSLVLGEARGYADVFYRDHFAWENKAPGKNLDAALRQLQQYSLALSNPPLLVVCDRLTIRIHTQFNGHPSETHTVRIEQLDQPERQALLRRLWLAPESFRPRTTSRDITEAAAKSFATLAAQLRARGHAGEAVAHFLTQCLFCFFAEDVGLLPGRMFERLVGNRQLTSDKLTAGLASLFTTMQTGGLYGPDDIPWFNGGLFAHIAVPRLEIIDITELRNAAALNWSAIDVGIFGTLFERGLDPAKRSQLGAHYTDPATIARITGPVITRPLLQQWELIALDLRALAAKITKNGDAAYRKAHARLVDWLERLRAFRILDPACGSGNFLFMGLKALKDVELISITQAAALGLDREQDLVTGPHNLLGIELNEYAAELARVSVWIGEIQWRMAHGYAPKTNPVLEPLEQIECRDALLPGPFPAGEGRDGAAAHRHPQRPIPPPPAPTPTLPQRGGSPNRHRSPWPRADVVVGNPPFLGGSKKRRELGAAYFDVLNDVYGKRVPGAGDLVCYWFAKSLDHIVSGNLSRAGLVSTNSIRGGANRRVLDAIVESSRIFDAWSDEPWVNEGAAVRVSLVCFGASNGARLNGVELHAIQSDLTGVLDEGSEIDLSSAKPQHGSGASAFEGLRKDGALDISGQQARSWLALPNPHGQSNADVLFPLINGIDITRRNRDGWVIDTGESMSEQDAALYEAPFQHIVLHVKPVRAQNNDRIRRTFWWRFGRNGEQLRAALKAIPRYINTPRVAKHRLFVWQQMPSIPDTATVAIARADDTTFGILHSRFHELWSLRMCTWLGVGNDPRYTPTTCFETFPFPAGLTPLDTAHQRTEAIAGGALIPAGLPGADFKPNQTTVGSHQAQAAINNIAIRDAASAIAQAAQRLDTLRRNWLNPPEWTQAVPEVVPLGLQHSPYPDRIEPRPGLSEPDAKALKARTLTNLYNQRPAWLAQAHAALDAAVAAAYGWADYTPATPDDEILRRLLQLNRERAAQAGGGKEAVS